jgi:hypothetical protein
MKKKPAAYVNLEQLAKLVGGAFQAERLMNLWLCAGNDTEKFRQRALEAGYKASDVNSFLDPNSPINQ